MSTIITRSGKGSPLTNNEMDQNLINLNTDKLEAGALTSYAPLAGATFTGPVEVPAGASGAQVPQRAEVVGLTGNESIGGVKTFTSRPKVPAGATLDEVPQAQEIFGKSQSFQTVTRLNGTAYTNSTGKPIVLYVSGVTSTTAGFIAIAIEGLRVASNSYATTSGAAVGCTAVIPPGLNYAVIWSDMASTTAREYR